MKIPQFKSFVDLDDYAELKGVFENNYIAEGPFCKKFQDQLLSIIGSKYGVFAPNGTLALYLGMLGLGIGPGDEVVVQNTTFIASANSVTMTGATPVFVDVVSHRDLSIDISKIVITSKTKAIMVAHLFGTVCSNMNELVEFCNSNEILLIEDAAQTIGITDNAGKHCGTFGDIGTFSFYADKTITTAEGGFIVAKDPKVYEKMLFLRNQGRKNSGTFIHPEIGYNFRITDLQGALGLSQLKKLPFIINSKTSVFRDYQTQLDGHVEFLKVNEDFSHIPFRVVVFVDDAESTIAYMAKNGIEGRSVFYPLNRQPCYSSFDSSKISFSKSDECYKRGICLPTWVGLSQEQVEYVCLNLKRGI